MSQWMEKRVEEWRKNPLWVSLLYSILIHLVVFLMWRFGVLNLPDRLIQAFVKRKPPIAQRPPPNSPTNFPSIPREIPLTFIEIEPSNQAPPKDPKFYSAANSQAANPDPKRDTSLPKVDGRQENIAKLRDVPRAAPPLPAPPAPVPPPPKPSPVPPPPRPPKPEIALQPTPPPPKEVPPPKQPPEPAPGNTDTARAAEAPKPPSPQPAPDRRDPALQTPTPPPPLPKPRPRTLADARQQAGLAGEKMKQEGGVRRVGQLAVDAKATPFGEYDAAWIRAVQEQWYNLLDNSSLSPKSGKVVLQFNLKFDGSITDLRIRETEVGEPLAILCQRAVVDPSPYPKWPTDMHRMVGGNVRPVTLTFFYY
jgi:hypothetical protein